MNTLFMLFAEFETADIPLEKVALKYFGVDEKVAKMRAARQALPVPVFRGESQKCPWLVKAQDLAKWIDKQHAEGKRDFEKIHGVA